MANKAPPSGQNKKPSRSVKEKRAAKQEKKQEKSSMRQLGDTTRNKPSN